jgi:hypothetical protein
LVQQGFTSSTVTATTTGSIGAIAFLIRRPGCALCQQQAYTLTILSKILCPEYFTVTTRTEAKQTQPQSSSPLSPNLDDTQTSGQPLFTIFGVVKDIYDTVGMMECQQLYFPFPMYMNPTHSLYHAFGDRKLSLSHIVTNPQVWKMMFCTMYHSIFPSSPTKSNNGGAANRPADLAVNSAAMDTTPITTSTEPVVSTAAASPASTSSSSSLSSHKADGILQGGILFLSNTGAPIAMYPEETGQPLNIGYILQTLDYMIQQYDQQQQQDTTDGTMSKVENAEMR